MINNPSIGSFGSQPRGIVLINGQRIPGLISFTIDNNNFFQADTFRVTLSLSAQPVGQGFQYWSVQEQLTAELFLGYPNDPVNYTKLDLTSFLLGYVDDIEFDPNGDTITLAGRDLTSRLIDFKNTIVFTGGSLVASDIVTQIAVARGLTPVVTKTSVAVGGYYQIVKSLIESNAHYWDIITKLAQVEQFQVYVKGSSLYFEPRTPPNANPYVIRWTAEGNGNTVVSNAPKLTFSRNLSIAKNLKVRVLSFDQKTKKTVNEVADRKRIYSSTTNKASKSTEPPQEYVYNLPNLTSNQAQKRAQSILTEISAHEMTVHAELPGDLLLTPQNIVQVTGTGSAFDQTYFPQSVTRTYSMTDGFVMSLSAKNQTPNNPT
jgi:phage protein D